MFQNPVVVAAIAAPLLAAGAYKITEKEITNEPFLKMKSSQDQDEYYQKYTDDRHETYKELGNDTVEEILEHLI